ncbi:DUF2157 domain-containing protein [Aciduricibacillus chroicocephali]|uniref:DUF2157 domain-containing protein n=1 Tax=Aciduricibacillus chroicocephali TaxID=3054939 RepID=A0ABY9KV53_9BACI|nr:DUF2157 domain-containing protein [Bacillaceae bacterium 44XB]
MKRVIGKGEFAVLEREFIFLEKHGELEQGKAEQLLGLYEAGQGHAVDGSSRFLRIMLAIGAALVGLGILSFIASNWAGLDKLAKFLLLIFGLIVFYAGGFGLERRYPKTARSLYYIGAAIYGAAIFLIGQMFHLSGGAQNAFILWGAGLLPLAVYLRDKWVGVFAALTFILGGEIFFWSASGLGLRYLLILLIPLLLWVNDRYLNKSKAVFVLTGLAGFSFIHDLLAAVHADAWLQMLGLFVLGVLLVLLPFPNYRTASSWVGSIVYGIAGITLTIPYVWEDGLVKSGSGNIPAAIMAIVLAALLIYLLRKNNLPAIIVVCGFIFRYYADFTFDFMPKSLFFIIGGLILIGFGFWFERSRKERGGQLE